MLAEFRRQYPESTRPDEMLRFRHYMRRDFRAADSLLRDPAFSAPATPGEQIRLQFERVSVATVLGRMAESKRLATDLAAMLASNGATATALFMAALPAQEQAFFLGDWDALERAADSLMPPAQLNALPEADRPYMGLAYVYAVSSRPDRVRELRREWTAARPAEARLAADSVYWDALAAVSEGRWRDAAIGFDRHRVMAKCPGCNLWDAARAWEHAGEADSALARYELSVTQVEGRADGGDVAVTLAPTYKRLGELYEAKGIRAKALEYYGDFVDLWRDADPVLQPQVTEARARMAALAGEK